MPLPLQTVFATGYYGFCGGPFEPAPLTPSAPSKKFVMMMEKPPHITNKSQKQTVHSSLETISTPFVLTPAFPGSRESSSRSDLAHCRIGATGIYS